VSTRSTFLDAADAVANLVAQIEDGAWERPGLGVWDVRSLVGHTSRAIVTVLTYVEQPADGEDLATPEQYFAAVTTAAVPGGADAVAERGREAGRALGDDPAGTFRSLVQQVSTRLTRADDAQLVSTIGGGMRLDHYLSTRTFELVVHGLDISRATGTPIDLPTAALTDACALAGRIAVLTGRGPSVLIALTGREPLPAGFSIL
jgi:uncharacterized protein (TIGR03083 family)